jgi:hypothetical protein
VVVKAEWDKFINEQKLSSFIEPINQTSMSNKRHYFIHFGRKKKLTHHPIDQLKGMQRKKIKLVNHQCKFQKQLSKMLVLLGSEESTPITQDEESLSSELEAEEEVTPSADSFLGESLLDLSLRKTPLLLQLFGGSTKAQKHQLNSLLLEIFLLMKDKSNSIDFVFKNGNKGQAVLVPQVSTTGKSQVHFMLQANRLSWIEGMLEHATTGNKEYNKEDLPQWLAFYLGKKYDGSFTLASEALGIPLVQQLDSASTLAMWTDANINYMQQQIIKTFVGSLWQMFVYSKH